jgi:Uma2 family endonuclease
MSMGTVVTDTWVQADWPTYLGLVSGPEYERTKSYFRHGWMRLEMSPVGRAHAEDNHRIAQTVSLYAFGRGVPFRGLVNVSLRKTGQQEAQPDLAYYLGREAAAGVRSNSPIDLDAFAAPTLVIEVAACSLQDDLTTKRTLYGELGVNEYWVVDSEGGQVLLFGMSGAAGALEPIERSQWLPGLSAKVLSEALRLGHEKGEGAAMQYILDLSD